MSTELLANSPTPGSAVAIATLSVAVNTTPAAGTVETWTFSSAPPAALQGAGQYRFTIDSEICIDVTGGAGASRQVQRGAEGSTVATHLQGASIFHGLTAGGLSNFISTTVVGSANAFTAKNTFAASNANYVAVNGAGLADPGMPTQSTFYAVNGNILNPDANVRPVAASSVFNVAPASAPLVSTDFHGWDLKTVALAGSNVNGFSRIYALESTAQNSSAAQMDQLSGVYGLVAVGTGGAGGGTATAWGIQSSMNMSNNAVVGEFDAFRIRPPFNSGGGGTITQAYGLRVQKWAASGMTYTNPPYAVYVDQGGGTLYTQEAIVVNNVSGSSSTGTAALAIVCDNTKTVNAVTIANAGTGAAFQINQTGAGTADAVAISQNTAGRAIFVQQTAAAVGVGITQTGAGYALNINANAVGAAGFYPINLLGYDYGPNFQTSQNGGQTLLVQKLASGNGVAARIINKGTGDTVQWQIGATPTTAMKFTALGSLVVGQGAQLATTATDGFVYLPSCAGAPTGVPTTQTGSSATVYDTTNHKLWVYDGGWKGVVLA